MTDSDPAGRTTIAPEVLLTIARLSTLSVDGVTGIAQVPGGFNRLFRRGESYGVRAEVEDEVVYLDVYVVIRQGVVAGDVQRSKKSPDAVVAMITGEALAGAGTAG